MTTQRKTIMKNLTLTTLLLSLVVVFAMMSCDTNTNGDEQDDVEITTIIPFDSGVYGRGRYADSGCPTQVFISPLWVSMTDNRDTSGDCEVNDIIHRNYFKFDLSDFDATVVRAELILEFPEEAYDVDPTREQLVFALRQVNSLHTLFGFDFENSELIPLDQAVWEDFGSGPGFGSHNFTEEDEGTIVTIVLNDDAVAAINDSHGEIFSISGQSGSGGYGSVTMPPGNPKDFLFLNTGPIEFDPRFLPWPTTRELRLFHD